jgi:hypothetical protein
LTPAIVLCYNIIKEREKKEFSMKSIYLVVDNASDLTHGDFVTKQVVLEKAFLTEESAQAWIDQQEYWWFYEIVKLPVE